MGAEYKQSELTLYPNFFKEWDPTWSQYHVYVEDSIFGAERYLVGAISFSPIGISNKFAWIAEYFFSEDEYVIADDGVTDEIGFTDAEAIDKINDAIAAIRREWIERECI